MLEKPLYFITTAVEAAFSAAGLRSVYEQPAYTVRQDLGDGLQIRDYQPRKAAETTVARAGNDDAASAAFERLFAYIAGQNRGSRRVAMTTPVQMAGPDYVAMTTPVQIDPAGDALTMRFFLPARVAANPPEPSDEHVRITTMPAATIAALRFSGELIEPVRAMRQQELLSRLDGTGWRPKGPPFVLSYDPPFTPRWLRRNEVAVEVELS